LLAGAILIVASLYMGWLSWHVVLFAVLAINANQIHKWAHMNSVEVPIIVGWLQKLHVLQTPHHHGKHHAGSRTTHYCVITNFLNPLLEEVIFGSRVERVIERVTGVKRRSETEELKLLGLSAA
jgi:ubiquitin-conjugating enzyme E2 variant